MKKLAPVTLGEEQVNRKLRDEQPSSRLAEAHVRARAMKSAGSIEGENPERAENARAIVRARIASRQRR